MKAELFKARAEQRTHTFTNSDGNMRIILGQYTTDGYRDTVEDGIAIVKEYIMSLAADEKNTSTGKHGVPPAIARQTRHAEGIAHSAATQNSRRNRQRTLHGRSTHYRRKLPTRNKQTIYTCRSERQQQPVATHFAGNDRKLKQ